ncbi:glycoside hydrolase family 13 protein [bacterium]|nr:glycoside hydrolase family 13 protein [bacterium]
MKKNKNIKVIINIIFFLTIAFANNPDWAKDAIWYQIFPERFYNGDGTNDPTAESLWGVWPWERQTLWKISPWTSDWYELQPWEKANEQDYDYQFQLRRYGGDIQGIIDKLDYLQNLGVNAIYLNPIFDSPSNHKYGAEMYHHIDRHFGPDPIGDTRIIDSENPADPQTWEWTAADKLFLKLIDEIHKRNMHIIIDGVFNHVGLTFWAFQDVILNRENSKYYKWFNIEGSGLPDKSHLNEYKNLPIAFIPNGGNPMRYTGYVEDLPAFRQDEFGPVEPIRNHLHEIIKRWMDPNGDGDPADGIDGWRLDVAERLQIKFCNIFGKWVRDLNPNAYITGEVWWEDFWNNKQFDASPWLAPGRFDAVMNYRFGEAMFNFFINKEHQIKPSELQLLLDSFINDYGEEKALYLQSILDSHDMERLASAVVNPDRWIDHSNNLKWNQYFSIRKPNLEEKNIQKTITAFQFAFIGAPFIYYGDEVGMWGADDPDCRKPMIWGEFVYDEEKTHPCDLWDNCNYSRPTDKVEVEHDLLDFYKSLIKLRNTYPALRRGTYKNHYFNNDEGIFAFIRELNDEKIVAIFNSSDKTQYLSKKILPGCNKSWNLIAGKFEKHTLKPKGFAIFLKN